MIKTLLICLLVGSTTIARAQTTAFSHGDPTNHEQHMLELINRARANPAEEGIRLMDTQDPSVQQAYSAWQINKPATKAAFATYPARAPLTFHVGLLQAARAHTADMVANNFQDHTGSDGSSLTLRYQRVGYQSQGMYGENIAAYGNSVWYGHCGLNVDWGPQNQIDLGHRTNIMNFQGAQYTEIGIGITVVPGGGIPNVGPFVITQDFGLRSVRYVVGVVYDDKNKNQEYDPGEGLPGVRIQPSSGSYHAITSASGGYAFPYTGTSTVTIVASGGGLQQDISRGIVLTGDNVKADFSVGGAVPGTVALSFPANNATSVRLPANIAWRRIASVDSYRVQVASSSSFSTGILIDSVLADSTIKGIVAPCGSPLYWRVRAINENGPGPWSSVWNFTPLRVTSVVADVVSPKGAATSDGNVRFTWRQAPNDPISYELSVLYGGQKFYADTTITDTTALVPGFALHGAYEWRVRARNACGWHTWTSIAQFALTVTSVTDEGALPTPIAIIPSPVTSESIVRVGVAFTGSATVRITDLAGRTIAATPYVFSDGLVDIPLRTLLGPTSLVAGAYMLSIELPHRIITHPLVVAP